MDLVPNHSSKQHPWFTDSVNGVEPYTDYYVWSNETPANSTGWHLDETRKQVSCALVLIVDYSNHAREFEGGKPRASRNPSDQTRFWYLDFSYSHD